MALPAKKPRSASAERKRQAATQADDLRRTREAHARETAEDYLEAIADLVSHSGEARVVDLARKLGVTHVTVNRTVARLRTAGYVTAQPYRAIFLTDEGRRMAVDSKRRHEVVVRFLLAIGVPETAALRDAEGLEHHVGPETLAAFERRLKHGF